MFGHVNTVIQRMRLVHRSKFQKMKIHVTFWVQKSMSHEEEEEKRKRNKSFIVLTLVEAWILNLGERLGYKL